MNNGACCVVMGMILMHALLGDSHASVSQTPAVELADPNAQLVAAWRGETVQDLWNEYHNIFKSTFILERSRYMTPERLELMFSGFCAVSGSPVRPNDYNRYLLRLDTVTGGRRTGSMHYCCWPCVCDTQDFIRIDSKTITTSLGPRQYHFAVLGNPCDKAHKLNEPFVQPFGFRQTTLAHEAAEVRCIDGVLQGATLSDNGFPIISMFFDLPPRRAGDVGEAAHGGEDTKSITEPAAPRGEYSLQQPGPFNSSELTVKGASLEEEVLVASQAQATAESLARRFGAPQPGRVRVEAGVTVQDEYEWKDMCSERAAAGYNSGMGEIFRKQCWVPVNEKFEEKIKEKDTWGAIEDLTGWLVCNDGHKLCCLDGVESCGRLSLAYNGLGDHEAIALAKGLKKNRSINTLHLNNDFIHEKGIQALCDALAPGPNKKEASTNYGGAVVEELDLRNNLAGPTGASHLAGIIGTNRLLKRIYLSGNSMGNIGMWHMVKGLQYRHKDTLIDLRFNGFDRRLGCNPDGTGDADDWVQLEAILQKMGIPYKTIDTDKPRGIQGWPEGKE